MTSLNLDENQAKYQIRGYKPGAIQINDKVYTKSIIVAPDRLIENWAPQSIAELKADTLGLVLELHPDILLIGTGDIMQLILPEVYGELINHGIGVEIMNTHSACSTYNALSAENREVVAALLL